MSQKKKTPQRASGIPSQSTTTPDADVTPAHRRLGGSKRMNLPIPVQQELSRRVSALMPRRPLLPEAIAKGLRKEVLARMPESPEQEPRRRKGG